MPRSTPAQKNVHFVLIFGTFRFADYTLTNKDVQREIEIIKQFRQKDSVRIALLLNEIQELINAKKQIMTLKVQPTL